MTIQKTQKQNLIERAKFDELGEGQVKDYPCTRINLKWEDYY